MSSPAGQFKLATANGSVFTNTQANDFIITTYGQNQNIHIGPKESIEAPLTVNSNQISVSANIIPVANEVFSLGSATNRFQSLYIAQNTIYLGNAALSYDSITSSLVITTDDGSGGTVTTPVGSGGGGGGTINTNYPEGQLIVGGGASGLWTSSNLKTDLLTGYFGIGLAQDSNPEYPLHVNGAATDCNISIFASHDIAGWSDRRLKDNFEIIPEALDKVMQIHGYTFTRKDAPNPSKRSAGVIAQEVLEVLPEVVATDTNGYLTVSYANMVSLLIEAIRDLKEKNDALDVRVARLEES
jgi:hypothetical protein